MSGKSRILHTLLLATIICLANSTQSAAQATATMQVKVRVVSGASSHVDSSILMSNTKSGTQSGNVEITSAPNTEIHIIAPKQVLVTNTFGEEIFLSTQLLSVPDQVKGTHAFKLNGEWPPSVKASGFYQGKAKTQINYL
jgi:hypothetical protein